MPAQKNDPVAKPPDSSVDQTKSLGGPNTLSGVDAEGLPKFAAPTVEGELGRLGRYRIQKLLGQGGMGAVFLAHDEKLRRKIALKVMLPKAAANAEAKDRFLREARSAAQISSEYVVAIYDADEVDGIPFIALQYLEGKALDQFMLNKGPLRAAQVMRIGREAALGLAVAHQLGLIHRDIKPSNLWLEAPHGRVKILDFGLAKSVDGSASVDLTGSGVLVGTPDYMSPEQPRGEKLDHRTDIYSLGAVLYRLCTGELPVKGATAMAVLTSLAIDEPKPIRELNPDIPEPLAELIHQMLAKRPDERPADATEVADRLSKMVSSQSTASMPPSSSPLPTGGEGPGVRGPASGSSPVRTDSEGPPSSSPLPTGGGGPGVRGEPAQDSAPPAEPPTRTLPPVEQAAELAPLPGKLGGLPHTGWLIALALLLLLGGILFMFGGQIIRIATNKGELVIVVDDPTIEIRIVQGEIILNDKTNKREFVLTADKGEIEVHEKDGIKLVTKQFELTRGGKTTVKVTFKELAEARKPKDRPNIALNGREVADWVLSVGGEVHSHQHKKLQLPLPAGSLDISKISLAGNLALADDDLLRLSQLKMITFLSLQANRKGTFARTPKRLSPQLAGRGREFHRR